MADYKSAPRSAFEYRPRPLNPLHFSTVKLIAGMHRSGTSLVARLVFELGGDLGDPATFYEPDRWNPDGYFEQTEIHAINMPLINGPFWKLAYFFLPSDTTILRRGRKYAEPIRTASVRYRGKVVKENRFCLTLPAWLDQGAEIERILVVLREPSEVALSLKRRNRVTLKRGLDLWLEHNRRLLDVAARHDLPRHFVRYDALLDERRQPSEAVAAMKFLGVGNDEAGICAMIRKIAEPGQRHHAAGDDTSYPAAVHELWQRLLENHESQRIDQSPGD